MKLLFTLARIAIGFTAIAATTRAIADNQEYDWTGAPGFSGQIVLDSNYNQVGSLGDIVSFSITTAQGIFVLRPYQVYDSSDWVQFSWNPNQITGMFFAYTDYTTFIAWVGVNMGAPYPAGTNLMYTGIWNTQNSSSDYTGSWIARSSVPDTGSTVAMLGGAFAGLVLLRRRSVRYPASNSVTPR
jgi:hypothetical protein